MGRFYSGNGKFVGLRRLPNLLTSLRQTIVRKATGRIPRQPWIPFAAAHALDLALRKDWRVWEVGSGYSTLWLADRVARVTSIEASKDWFDLLSRFVKRENLTNVDLRHEWRGEKMTDFSELPDDELDLLFIDGGPRSQCLVEGFPKVKGGGLIYLDNWDNDGFWAEARSFVTTHGCAIRSATEFIDYVPAQVGVYVGLLLQKAPLAGPSE